MVPVHDTDIAEERFAKAEWENYELWENVEVRLRRRKWLWIGSACALFLALSSVPIFMERLPKWSATAGARRLAQQIGYLKREAAIEHQSYRIRFSADGKPDYVIERAPRCTDSSWTPVTEGSLFPVAKADGYRVLSPQDGDTLGVPGLLLTLCYDILSGATVEPRSGISGFGLIPAVDYTEHRLDRLSVLLVSGPSGSLSFD